MSETTPEPTDVEALLGATYAEAREAVRTAIADAPDSYPPDEWGAEADAAIAVLVPLLAQQRAEALREALEILTDFASAPGLHPTAGPDHPAVIAAAGGRRALDVVTQRVSRLLARADRIAPTTEACDR